MLPILWRPVARADYLAPRSKPENRRLWAWLCLALSSGLGYFAGLVTAAEPREAVSLQLKWHHQFQFAGYYAAQAQGYYEAENLTVRIIEGGVDRPPLQTVLAGGAHYGVGDTDVVTARLRGQPVVVCAAIFQHTPYVLMSRLDRNIRTPSDLVGKTVMLSDDQGAAQLRAMLVREGIDPRLVTTIPHSWDLADLIDGKVDAQSAYATVEPALLRARGVEPSLLRGVDYGVDFYGDTLFTTETEIATNPKRVAAFVRASLRGWDYAMTHAEELAALIARMEGVAARGITARMLEEEATAMKGYVLRDVVEIGHMNPGRWQQIARILSDADKHTPVIDLTGLLYDPHPPVDTARLRWLGGLAVALVIFGALVVLWSVQLRKRVRVRTLALQQEIIHRQSVEQELLASESQFRELAENITDVFWITDVKTQRLLYLSPAYAEVWGRPNATLFQSPTMWQDSLFPADRDRIMAAQAKQPSGDYNETYRIERPDGGVRWIHDRAFPVRDALGQVYRIVGIAKDITERRSAEEKLREQASLLDKARDAILVRDLQHRIVYWNQSAERLYGWKEADIAGRSVRDFSYADPAAFDSAMQTLLAQGDWSGEVLQATKDGRQLTVESRWTLVRDEAGQPRSVLVINTDITERRKLEQQFLRAQRMESIGTLAGGIAHDLNNLLSPILMGAALLKRLETSAAGLKIVASIESSAKRGADLVKQVLSFARGVEGARVLVQVGHIIREIESITENTFPKNIAIEIDLPRDLPPVIGDPTQLNQVLLNLCVNARDAMPHGGPLQLSAREIVLEAPDIEQHRGVMPGRYVLVEIADKGSGISPETLKRIFEPFFTTKEFGKGTGLGLSTALGIVRSHGGILNVASEVGVGSNFRIYLPAAVGAEGRAGAQLESTGNYHGDGELILLVDDESVILSVTKQTLEAFGYRVITAANGELAIGLFAERRAEIAVVLTDMMMPGMDGSVLIAALLLMEPGVRVIAASGLRSGGLEGPPQPAGVRYFLAKPYSAEALLRTLRQILGKDSQPPMPII